MRPCHRASALLAGVALVVAPPPAAAGQLDSATYFALDRGMSESELLIRAGEPDLVTHPGGAVISRRSVVGEVDEDDPRLRLIGAHRTTRFIEVKQYHYIPDHTEHDPHLTIVTLRGGRVFEIERTKLLTRPRAPVETAVEETRPRLTDTDIRLRQVDRVLGAAEAYAATRARLKDEGDVDVPGAAGETSGDGGLYRGTTADGVPYFGDRPMPE